jgi:hypothetical protein
MAEETGSKLTNYKRICDAFKGMGDQMFLSNNSKAKEEGKQEWQQKIDIIYKELMKTEKKSISVESVGDKLQQVAIAAEKMLGVADALRSGDPHQFIVGVISTISSFAVLAGPPGAVVSGVLQIACIFYKFLVTDWEPQESLPSKIRNIVRTEISAALEKFKIDQLKSKAQAWMMVADKIQRELDLQIRHEAPYAGYQPGRYDELIGVQELLACEVSDKVSTRHEAATCVSFIILYIKVSILYHAMLMSHLRLAHQFDSTHVPTIKGDIETLKDEGREMLAFLSDKTLLSAAGMVGDRKRLKMIAYADLQKSPTITIIDNYCTEILGLPKPKYTVDDASNSSVVWPVEWDPKCYEAHELNNDHYFALVNHTKLPISVFSGTAGYPDSIKHLKFQEVVRPGECYTRMCTKGYMFTDFEAGGVLCLGSDAKTLSGVKQAHLIQFAMSYRNPLVGFQASKIKTVISDGPGDPPGQDALNGLENSGDNEDAIPFRYNGDLFILKACADVDLGLGWLQYIPGVDLNVYRVFRFCITQTSIEELKK